MDIEIPAGRYVLAVSGGVDSMALLDLLAKKSELELIVAHFNHGIRPDAGKDEELVKETAKQLRLSVEVGYGHLGKKASEAAAREARYRFLERVRRKHGAKAIITAHHQDDLIETAFINLLRGTGRRGLVAISANKRVIRPLLHVPKQEVIKYAKSHHLSWHEDETNIDTEYLRNYLRKNLIPNLTSAQKEKLISNIEKVAKIDRLFNIQVATLSHKINTPRGINRASFSTLPYELGNELIRYWLRQLGTTQFDRKTIDRLNVTLRTAKGGTHHVVSNNLYLAVGKGTAHFSDTLKQSR